MNNAVHTDFHFRRFSKPEARSQHDDSSRNMCAYLDKKLGEAEE